MKSIQFVVKYWLGWKQFPVTEISGVEKVKIKSEGDGIIAIIPVINFSNWISVLVLVSLTRLGIH